MKTRILVRENGGAYEGGLLGSQPVDIELLPRLGDHVVHQTFRELLRVDIVVVAACKDPVHTIYVTKVDERSVVKDAEKSPK